MRTSTAPALRTITAKPIRKATPRFPEPPLPKLVRRRVARRDRLDELACPCSVCAMQDDRR